MSAAVEQAAQNLVARRNGREAGPLPPLSEDDAYRAQARVLALLGESVAGWKVAVVGGRPVAAPVPAGALMASGSSIAQPPGEALKVETELGFRLGRDLPRAGGPYSRNDILGAIESVRACFEIVGPRVPEPPASPFPAFLADSLGCAYLVAGDGMAPTALPAEGALQVDGVGVAAGPHPHGDPLAGLLAWANAQCDAAGGLRRGQVIITGTFTGALPIHAPGRLEGRFDGLPPVIFSLI
jgi:2-keto-4-pentenoate hydratase